MNNNIRYLLFESLLNVRPSSMNFKTIFDFRQEFVDIARWVAGCEIDPHLVEIVYALLDDDNDGHLSIKEFTPVFFQWRKSRGFQHQSVQIAMGKLTI